MRFASTLALCLSALALCATSCASEAEPRFETASLHGIVMDAAGRAIDGAHITLDGTDVATSSRGGKFHIPNAPWGQFLLRASAVDFEDAQMLIDFVDPSLMLVIRLEGAESISRRCAEALASGDAALARILLERLRALGPERAEALYLEILVLRAEGRIGEAILAHEALYAKHPGSTEIALLGEALRGPLAREAAKPDPLPSISER